MRSRCMTYGRIVTTLETDRLILRGPVEGDRSRFVELFTDPEFMEFAASAHDIESAHRRFDRMLITISAIPYAKQPIIERSTGTIIGYTGVDVTAIEGVRRLEWGWRLVPDARGHGFATEATTALLALADACDDGEMLCIISADNVRSRRVADKCGFRRWKRMIWSDGVITDLLVRQIGAGGPPLSPPTER